MGGRRTARRDSIGDELDPGDVAESAQSPARFGRVGHPPVARTRVPTAAGDLAEPTHDLGMERHHDDAGGTRPRPPHSDDDHAPLQGAPVVRNGSANTPGGAIARWVEPGNAPGSGTACPSVGGPGTRIQSRSILPCHRPTLAWA